MKLKRTAYRLLLLSCVLIGGSSSVYAGIEPRFADPVQPRFADPVEPRFADPIEPRVADPVQPQVPPAPQPSPTATVNPVTPAPSTGKVTVLTVLESGVTNYGRSIQTGKVLGDYFYITFTDYNRQTGEFGGTIDWKQYGIVDTIKGKVKGDTLVFSQINADRVKSVITVRVTDSNHLSGTWSIPGTKTTGTIKFTINPNDVSHLLHTYKIFVPSSSATLETYDSYITKTSAGARNGSVTIKSDGTYMWNSAVDGKVIKGKWTKSKDISYPLILLKGERGHDWKIGESVHSGADIVLWDGVSSQKADLVK